MWRDILRWIGPKPPGRAEEGDGMVLGIIALLLVTVSLPYLLGILFGG
ncbi:hypothetical protein [Tardiphaga sp.]